MHRTTKFTTVLALGAVAISGPAAVAAQAPVISKTKTIAVAGQRAPVTVPGTGLKKGATLKRGQRIIARDLEVHGAQKPVFQMTCPGSSVLKGLGTREGDKAGFTVVSPNNYTGKRTVKVRGYAVHKAADATGRIYALCQA